MKKFSLLCLILPFLSSAQSAFGENAVWHYSYSEFGYSGYKKVQHIGDTTIYNMTWLKFSLEGLSEIRTGPGPNDILQDSNATWPPIFLATRNDSVFRMTSSGPFLLYDFNADVGDSWQFNSLDTSMGCPDLPTASVIGKGVETIDGQQLAYLDLAMPMDSLLINGQNVYQISAANYLSSRVYRQLGSLSYNALFDSSPNLCNGASFKAQQLDNHNLRCFSNAQVQINRTGNTCDYWSKIGLSEIPNPKLQVYPNPTTGPINIESDVAIGRLALLDFSGKRLKSLAPQEELFLDIKPGLYFLEIELITGQIAIVKLRRL